MTYERRHGALLLARLYQQIYAYMRNTRSNFTRTQTIASKRKKIKRRLFPMRPVHHIGIMRIKAIV